MMFSMIDTLMADIFITDILLTEIFMSDNLMMTLDVFEKIMLFMLRRSGPEILSYNFCYLWLNG